MQYFSILSSPLQLSNPTQINVQSLPERKAPIEPPNSPTSDTLLNRVLCRLDLCPHTSTPNQNPFHDDIDDLNNLEIRPPSYTFKTSLCFDAFIKTGIAALTNKFLSLREQWDISPEKAALLKNMREKVLCQKTVVIERALCLGLGSFDPQSPVGVKIIPPASLKQLVVFETILECLREKFPLPPSTITFQDPLFTPLDSAFLQQRGYTAVPSSYKVSEIRDEGDRGAEMLTPSTLFFAPSLVRWTVVEVICAAAPSLYFGNPVRDDLISTYVVNKIFYSLGSGSCYSFSGKLLKMREKWVTVDYANLIGVSRGGHEMLAHLLKDFDEFGLSRDCVLVNAFGRADYHLMWEADMGDEEVMRKVKNRRGEIEGVIAEMKALYDGWQHFNRQGRYEEGEEFRRKLDTFRKDHRFDAR